MPSASIACPTILPVRAAQLTSLDDVDEHGHGIAAVQKHKHVARADASETTQVNILGQSGLQLAQDMLVEQAVEVVGCCPGACGSV